MRRLLAGGGIPLLFPVAARVVGLDPDDRFDARRLHLVVEREGAVEVPVVGNRHRRHL